MCLYEKVRIEFVMYVHVYTLSSLLVALCYASAIYTCTLPKMLLSVTKQSAMHENASGDLLGQAGQAYSQQEISLGIDGHLQPVSNV